MSPYLTFIAGSILTLIIAWILYINAEKKQQSILKQLQLEKDALLERASKAESRYEFLEEKLSTQNRQWKK